MGLRRKIATLAGSLLACAAVVLLPTEAWGTAPSNGTYTPDSFSVVLNSTSGGVTTASGNVGYVSRCVSGSGFTCAQHFDLTSAGTYGTLGTLGITFSGPKYTVLAGDPAVGVSYKSQYRCNNDTAGTYRAGSTGNVTVSSTSGGTASSTINVGASCTSSGNPVVEQMVAFATGWTSGGVATTYGAWIPYFFSGAPGWSVSASTCTVDTTSWIAAYDTSTSKLSLLFSWPVGSLPATSWNIRQGPQSVDTIVTTASKVYRSGSSNYGFDGKVVSGLTPGQTLRIESGTTPGCYGTVQILGSGTSITDSTGLGSDGTGDCSIVDVPCLLRAAVKWAFVPSTASMSDWQTQISTWNSHAPVSLVTSSWQSVSDFAYGIRCGINGSAPSGTIATPTSCATGDQGVNRGFDLSGGGTGSLGLGTGFGGGRTGHTFHATGTLDIMGSAATFFDTGGAGHWLYTLLSALIWVGFAYWLWQRAGWSFGSKEK